MCFKMTRGKLILLSSKATIITHAMHDNRPNILGPVTERSPGFTSKIDRLVKE